MITVSETKATTRFFDLFYRVDGVKSGMHHPDGILWVRRPDRSHRVHEDKVALVQVAPTLLDMFSLPAPPHMKGAALSGFRGLVD
jgi:predicted AlkP superfamily phosphohydrolase/phosphomutase